MLRDIKGTQRLARFMAFKVDGTGTASIVQGAQDATLTDNNTGDYTLTFATPFKRACLPVVSCLTATCYAEISAASASAVTILTKATSTNAATDADFIVHVIGYDSEDET